MKDKKDKIHSIIFIIGIGVTLSLIWLLPTPTAKTVQTASATSEPSRYVRLYRDEISRSHYIVTVKDITTGCLYSYVSTTDYHDISNLTPVTDKNNLHICEK